MDAFRLRIELPDRPGALVAVTGAIADSGANIVSIDVHEVDGGSAVDEITVEVPEGWLPAPLAAALASSGAGKLLASRHLASTEEPLTAALQAVAAMLAGDAAAVDQQCVEAIAGLAHGSAARLVDLGAAVEEEPGRMAVERRSTTISRAEEDGEPVWVLAALDDPADPHTVAFVSRPDDVHFSATEVSRVEALLRIRRRLLIGQETISP